MQSIRNIDGLYTIEGTKRTEGPECAVLALGQKGYIHSACYQEVVEMVYFGLQRAGYSPALASSLDACRDGQFTVVIGAHLLTPDQLEDLPPRTVIYNTENAGSGWFNDTYSELLRRFPVWDYSLDNA